MLGLCLLVLSPVALTAPAPSLKPSCAPGGNFDLAGWSLQTHTGAPDTIASAQLTGCSSGFSDKDLFFTSSTDGAMVMRVPGSTKSSGCKTTTFSQHCRTELRETEAAVFDPKQGRNRLRATLAVTKLSDESTVVGQILADHSAGGKPVCELYYSAGGVLSIGVGRTRKGGSQERTELKRVALGSKFSYEMRYEGGVLRVGIGGVDGVKEDDLVKLETFDQEEPRSYFKAGNYNQGDEPSEVKFYALETEHGG